MKIRNAALVAVIGAVTLTMSFALLSCGGGDGEDGSKTEVPRPTNAQGTPLSFEQARDALVQQLDGIGVNIGSMPDDVAAHLVAECQLLTSYAKPATVTQICNGIQQARDRADPGLLDIVVSSLRALKAG